jgi:hypothetical protein
MTAGSEEWLAEAMQSCGLKRNECRGDGPK